MAFNQIEKDLLSACVKLQVAIWAYKVACVLDMDLDPETNERLLRNRGLIPDEKRENLLREWGAIPIERTDDAKPA